MAQESDEALLARIDALEAQNQELKGLVNDLKAELDATEKRLDEIEAAQSKAPAGAAKGGGGGAAAEGGMSKKEKKAAAKAAAKAKEAAAPAGEKTLTKKEQKAADAKAADEKAEAKAHAAATKEGGKKGQDLSGMCDLGGMKYFTVAMEKCQGRWDLLEDAMAGACKVVDEAGDDRKGGAGHLGVAFLSCDEKKDTKIIVHMNKDLQEALPIKEWVEAMVSDLGVQGKILEVSEDGCTCKAIADLDTDKQLFPLKQRDAAINASFAHLRSKNLVMEEDEEEVDFGDMYEEAGVEW